MVGDVDHFVAEAHHLHLARVGVVAAKSALRASQRHTVTLAGIAGSAQIALRLSPSMIRQQIFIAISSL